MAYTNGTIAPVFYTSLVRPHVGKAVTPSSGGKFVECFDIGLIVAVLANFCALDTNWSHGETELQLRKYLHQIGLGKWFSTFLVL